MVGTVPVESMFPCGTCGGLRLSAFRWFALPSLSIESKSKESSDPPPQPAAVRAEANRLSVTTVSPVVIRPISRLGGNRQKGRDSRDGVRLGTLSGEDGPAGRVFEGLPDGRGRLAWRDAMPGRRRHDGLYHVRPMRRGT